MAITYHKATDEDFEEGVDVGVTIFRYIGEHKHVEIPGIIQGKSPNYRRMFEGTSVEAVKLTKPTPNASMGDMFRGLKSDKLDLSELSTEGIADMKFMFAEVRINTLDLTNFDTSDVTSMEYMFAYSYIDSLDLSSFDTNNVKRMSCMFDDLTTDSIDLSSFDTSNTTHMLDMFRRTTIKTKVLDISTFTINSDRYYTGIFNSLYYNIILVKDSETKSVLTEANTGIKPNTQIWLKESEKSEISSIEFNKGKLPIYDLDVHYPPLRVSNGNDIGYLNLVDIEDDNASPIRI